MCFWGDCILTAVHLINRIPSKALSNKSPYEILFHSALYHHLRNFGCLCFISTLSHLRHKFAPRARKCVFLGYPYGIKGYKVLDLQSNYVYVSRDTVFYETIFPYAECPPSPTSILDNFVFPHASISDFSPSDPIHNIPDPSLDHVSAEPLSIDSISVDPVVVTDPSLASQFSNPISCDSTSFVPLKTSARSHKPPSYLFDYSCQFAGTKPCSGIPYVLLDHLSYSHLGPVFHSFVMAVSFTPSEPVSFQRAVQFPEWRAAMDKEIEALEVNNT